MTTGKRFKTALNDKFFVAKSEVNLTPGKMIRILREKNELSQNQLALASGLTQPTISALENDQITLGIERAKTLANVLKTHPATLAFADWRPNYAA